MPYEYLRTVLPSIYGILALDGKACGDRTGYL